jgi:hypothetical protein
MDSMIPKSSVYFNALLPVSPTHRARPGHITNQTCLGRRVVDSSRVSGLGVGKSIFQLKQKLRLVTRFVKMTILSTPKKQGFERLASESFPKLVNRQILPDNEKHIKTYGIITYVYLSASKTI